MPIADEFVDYLGEKGYDPRSLRHSDFLSLLIIRDLIEQCQLIRARSGSGELVANLHHHQIVGTDDWQIDIAIGTCAGTPVPPVSNGSSGSIPIRFAPPVIIQIAIELKGVITEHGKARRNRLRDFLAFLGHAHRYDPKTVVAAFLAVNGADWFYSPLNLGKPGLNSQGTGAPVAAEERRRKKPSTSFERFTCDTRQKPHPVWMGLGSSLLNTTISRFTQIRQSMRRSTGRRKCSRLRLRRLSAILSITNRCCRGFATLTLTVSLE